MDFRSALRGRTGVGEYTAGVAAALDARSREGRGDRLDLTLFSSSWKDRLRPPPELAGVGVVDRRVPVAWLNFAWHRLGWPPAELLARAGFDVVHSMHPLLTPARRAAQVVTVHDLDFLAHPERTRAEIRRDYPALARAHAQRADRVVAVSEFTAGEVERLLGVPRARISVCRAGAPDWPVRAAAPRDGYVLFFGTLEPRKNVGALLDALERLAAQDGPRVSAVLAGRATPEAEPWLDRLKRPPLAGRVRHVGYVDPGARRALYEGARLLVQPSFDEGFGLPVLEAMTVGVPVVAADRGALPEVLGDAGLLVDATDAARLAHAIASLLTDDGLADACAERGAARARTFRWTSTADAVLEAYRLAVEHRAARRG